MNLIYKENQNDKNFNCNIIEVSRLELFEKEFDNGNGVMNKFDMGTIRANLFSHNEDIISQSLGQMYEILDQFFINDFMYHDFNNLTKLLTHNNQDISHLTEKVIVKLLEQPDISQIAIENGFLNDLMDYFPETWTLDAYSSIMQFKPDMVSELFGFGVFYDFLDILTKSPFPIIDIPASCRMLSKIVRFEDMKYQDLCYLVCKLFQALYKLIIHGPIPDFLKSVTKLIRCDHFVDNQKVNIFYHIFSLGPSESPNNINDLSICGENSEKLYLLPLINRYMDYESPETQFWYERTAELLWSWMINDSTDKTSIDQVWDVLFQIMETTIYPKASLTAVSALILYINHDASLLINQVYLSRIINLFMNCSFILKIRLSAMIAIAFNAASNEQMLFFVQEFPQILEMFFENFSSLDFKDRYVPFIIKGVMRFIDFCTLSQNGLIFFKKYILENNDLESWIKQVTDENEGETDFPPDDNLSLLIRSLTELVNQRTNDYYHAIAKIENKDNK
ncbi:hypothetical protein TRFO_31207 [Tritrichomonas foetus]|uniref:Uncharacterized protein n=1 Tax=Tritrichomonas foetus TaxID=1144522 RepID=A0A1J4JT01_9EUKA|nr:hypothetical protein TRFO_31207 [Tritrichomonas foetus]|eukprot:OHT01866.1 hypothetical protein TRFO_31207 [Tritrichomonas foetus]